ncbi:MAG: DUF6159 family protein [Candidatus Marsarchaeota archaeon]|nr:DUF6159 family protein [Candidatus Marsarchaeota archaeon]
MFEKMRNGFRLGSATRKLIFKDKKLLLYPVIGAIVSLAVMGVLFALLVFGGSITAFASGSSGLSGTYSEAFGIIALFALYVLTAFVSTYVTMAMFMAYKSHRAGKQVTIAQSFIETKQYLKQIFEWAIFYGIVLMIIRAIEQRVGGLGGMIVGGIGSMAIAASALFVVPVIMDNKTGPIASIKLSAKMLIDHFGSTFGGMVYSELYSLGIILLGVAVLIMGVAAISFLGAIAIIGIALGVAIIIFGGIINYTTLNLFRLILYEYVNGKGLPEGFDEEMIKNSVTQKRNRKAGMFA